MNRALRVSKRMKLWNRIPFRRMMCVLAFAALALGINSRASAAVRPVALSTQSAAAPHDAPSVPAKANVELRSTSISGGFAEITGLAISPLMVMSLFGAIDWYRAAPGSALPLHANPWVWGTLLAIFAIGQIARWTTRPVPWPVRKVFDAVHYLENKCSALLAAGLLLPYIASAMSHAGVSVNQVATAIALPNNLAFAGVPTDVMMYIAALALFAVVWVVSHTIDALVLLSPFALVDAALLSVRAAFLGVLLGALAIHPVLGAIVALPIVIFCMLVAGWCVRLNLFATTCAWDLLTMRWFRAIPHDGPVRAFLARPRAGLPIRTRGTIVPNGASMKFCYRPWFIMPSREVDLGAHPSALVCGVLWSTFVATTEQGSGALVALPPRYRSHEAVVAARFGAERKDGLILKGLAGLWSFIRNPFGIRTPTAAVQ